MRHLETEGEGGRKEGEWTLMTVGERKDGKKSHDCRSISLGVIEQRSQSTVTIMNILSLLKGH